VSSVAWSADGKQVVMGSYDGTAVLWEAATGKKRQTFRVYAK
jgi:WD40 repeat protein